MQLLCLADLHGYRASYIDTLSKYSNEADVILLLGDVCETYFYDLHDRFSEHPLLAVLGNHDYPKVFARHPYITHLHNQVVEVDGVRFAGMDGSVKREGEWEGIPGFTQGESLRVSKGLPAADILLSHTCPSGTNEKDNEAHGGFLGLREYVEAHQPRFNLHGHQHRPGETRIGQTRVIGMYGAVLLDADRGEMKSIIENP